MNLTLIAGLAGVLTIPAVGCAQDRSAAAVTATQSEQGEGKNQKTNPHIPRRLESVTWNSVTHELTWVVSSGQKVADGYKPTAKQDYRINMDKATMTYQGQTRRFSDEEAANVRVLMDLVSKYAADSTIWWDDGQGIPLDPNGKPMPGQNQNPNEDKPKSNPKSPDTNPVVLRVSADRVPRP